MKYKRDGRQVTLTMSADEYCELLLLLGGRLAALGPPSPENINFWAALEFINDLNRDNPDFEPYEIPLKQRGARHKIIELATQFLQREQEN